MRLEELDGCARRASIVGGPRDLAELRRLVECGEVTRLARGLYSLRGVNRDVVAARQSSGLVTCVSAAVARGLPVLHRPVVPHLALAAHQAAPRPGVLPAGSVLHWDAGVEVRPHDRGTFAPMAVAAAHVLRCLPPWEAIGTVDAALNRGLVSQVELAAQRPRTGKAAFDRLVRAVDARSQSLSETIARLALVDAGLLVEPQVFIEGVGRVDLLVEDLAVVELDGLTYHQARAQFREDRRRDRVLQLIGVPVLRFTFDDAVHGSGRLVAEVDSLVGQLRATGRPPVSRFLRRGARG